jgi:hypothetical protein
MRATGPPLVGATHDLGWRDPLAEQHLESGRLCFDAYAMCTWLSGPVDPDTRVERASWRVLAQQTGLSPHRVEMLCRRLRRKSHVDYRGERATKRRALGGLVVVHDSLVDGADGGRV